jgi:toxin CcdB
MARFDVYRNTGPHADTTPFLLDVQSNLLDGLESRVVVPLRTIGQFANVKLPARLTPVFNIENVEYLLETPKIAAVPRHILKNAVVSLASEQNRITAALDFLFQGY